MCPRHLYFLHYCATFEAFSVHVAFAQMKLAKFSSHFDDSSTKCQEYCSQRCCEIHVHLNSHHQYYQEMTSKRNQGLLHSHFLQPLLRFESNTHRLCTLQYHHPRKMLRRLCLKITIRTRTLKYYRSYCPHSSLLLLPLLPFSFVLVS